MLRRIVREKKGVLVCARRYASAESSLRAQPWAFADNTADFQKSQQRTTAARFNFDLAAKADAAQFPSCFALALDMKNEAVTPNLATYNTLLRAMAHGGYSAPTLAVLEDMLSIGVAPNVISFNHIIHVNAMQSNCRRV
jgi:hypothetical protein